ncbi:MULTISPECIES: hypothetical protein [Cupriavidus]
MKIEVNLSTLNGPDNLWKTVAPEVMAPKPSLSAAPASTVVDISNAGRLAASLDVSKASADVDAPWKLAKLSLRELVSRYDLNSITPRQMANLAVELGSRGEISDDVTSSFLGIEISKVERMDPNRPIDMIAHAKLMLDNVEESARAGSGTNLGFALNFYRESSKALADIMSFASSGRQRIASEPFGKS